LSVVSSSVPACVAIKIFLQIIKNLFHL